MPYAALSVAWPARCGSARWEYMSAISLRWPGRSWRKYRRWRLHAPSVGLPMSSSSSSAPGDLVLTTSIQRPVPIAPLVYSIQLFPSEGKKSGACELCVYDGQERQATAEGAIAGTFLTSPGEL